jgi:spermidine/putrescine transport system permease protein
MDAPLLRFAPTARRAIAGFAVLAYAFLYIPLAVLVVYSFSDSKILTFPIAGFSLRWYGVLARDAELIRSVVNSLMVAGTVVPLSLVLGGMAAFAIDRFAFPGRAATERLLMLPLMIPGLVTGLAILLFLKRFDVPLSLATVILGHSIAWMPIVTGQLLARLRRIDRQIEEASLDLGASRFETFWRVTLPSLRTAMIGSALLVFTLSFDEVAVTFFLTGSENTLPMQIWSMLRLGITPEINAIATVTIAASLALILLGLRLLRRDR